MDDKWYKLQVTLHVDPYTPPIAVWIQLDPDMVQRACKSYELGDDTFNVMMSGLMGRDYIRERHRALEFREDMANYFARQVADVLVDILGSYDTINGYKKKEIAPLTSVESLDNITSTSGNRLDAK